jgi:hypothetical protein
MRNDGIKQNVEAIELDQESGVTNPTKQEDKRFNKIQ